MTFRTISLHSAQVPFCVYFMRDEEIKPKRMFTVTRFVITGNEIFAYVSELGANIPISEIQQVQCFLPN